MKSWITLIAAFIFYCPQYGWAKTDYLKSVRAGEHDAFTRLVFEVEGPVRFETRTMKGSRKFSVLLYHTTSDQGSRKLSKLSQHVKSVELVAQTPHLEADIILSIPYFDLRAYALKSPDRVVVDAYRLSPRYSEVEQNQSLDTRTSAWVVDEPPGNISAEVPRKKSTKVSKGFLELAENKSSPRKPLVFTEEPPNWPFEALEGSSNKVIRETPVLLKTIEKNPSENQNYQPEADDTPYVLPSLNNRLETYLLVLLNVLTVVIIALIILMRSNNKIEGEPNGPDRSSSSMKRPGLNSAALLKTLWRDQKRIAILDARIHEEIDQ
jgi:hypothetical protein